MIKAQRTSMVSMKVMDAISNRRSIRKYQDKPVPEETVLKIVEAGVRAPCGCSLQKYSIIWVKDEEKRKILWESCRKYPFILEAPVTPAGRAKEACIGINSVYLSTYAPLLFG